MKAARHTLSSGLSVADAVITKRRKLRPKMMGLVMVAVLAAGPAAADGSTTVWFAPEQPAGVARGNWIQTDPDKGWFTILRLYSPLPSFFDKSWRASEIEPVP